MAAVTSRITIKLLIDTRSNKVLFGEAEKDFVDFMFSLLTLPLGSVIKLISPPSMIGSIGKLYQSVENLKETYFVANKDKSSLLQPKVSIVNGAGLLRLGTEATVKLKYYLCYYCKGKFTTAFNTMCPKCKTGMTTEVTFVAPPTSAPSSSSSSSSSGAGYGGATVGGFVKGVMIYMITDALEVTPMSAISSITLINRFSLKKDVQLEEKVAVVGMKEGLALLKASLDSPTALSDVFCSSTKKSRLRSQ